MSTADLVTIVGIMPYFACFAYFTKTKVQKQKWRIHDKR
jgi:hypothetical protein